MKTALLTSLASLLAAASSGAAIVDLSTGPTLTGAGATWYLTNGAGTDNGLPAGGADNGSPGLGIGDASLGVHADAYDNGLMMFVNNQIFAPSNSADLTGSTLTSSTVTLSGLDVTMQYYASQATPTLRTFATFTNPTGAAIALPIAWVTNFGSDTNTTVEGTSSGDLAFTTADRWLVTSDGGPDDPVNSTILFGLGTPAVTPSSVSQTVFNNSSTAGVLAVYNISVAAGATVNLMWFNQLSATIPGALAATSAFDAPNADLLAGLTETQLANTLNWDFPAVAGPAGPAVPEPTTALFGAALLGVVGLSRRRGTRA